MLVYALLQIIMPSLIVDISEQVGHFPLLQMKNIFFLSSNVHLKAQPNMQKLNKRKIFTNDRCPIERSTVGL